MYGGYMFLYCTCEYLRACLYYFFGQLGFKSLIHVPSSARAWAERRYVVVYGYLQPLPAGMYQDIITNTTTTTTTDWTICSGHHRHRWQKRRKEQTSCSLAKTTRTFNFCSFFLQNSVRLNPLFLSAFIDFAIIGQHSESHWVSTTKQLFLPPKV